MPGFGNLHTQSPRAVVQAALDGADGRLTRKMAKAVTMQVRPAAYSAGLYDCITVRVSPAPYAATAPPSWWPAKIQPKIIGARCLSNAALVSRTVGGTVANQSRAANTAHSERPARG